MRYEVRCNRIDQRIIDEQFDGDFDRATERGVFWEYFEDPESRSIVLITEENADNMELSIPTAVRNAREQIEESL